MKKKTAESEVNNEIQENETQQPKRLCDECHCREVCKLKAEYLTMQMAIDNLVVDIGRIEKLRDVQWIRPTILSCKHYIGPGMRGIW